MIGHRSSHTGHDSHRGHSMAGLNGPDDPGAFQIHHADESVGQAYDDGPPAVGARSLMVVAHVRGIGISR